MLSVEAVAAAVVGTETALVEEVALVLVTVVAQESVLGYYVVYSVDLVLGYCHSMAHTMQSQMTSTPFECTCGENEKNGVYPTSKMDDLVQLLKHHKTDDFTILIDSSQRDKAIFPSSSKYSIPVNVPFKHVISMGIVHASIPQTMYNVDTHCNTLVIFYRGATQKIVLNPQNFTPETLENALSAQLSLYNITAVYNEPTNTIVFKSVEHFAIDVENSTMRAVLGIDTVDPIIFSVNRGGNDEYNYIAPKGVVCLQGEPCVCVVCDEILTHRALTPGLGPIFFDSQCSIKHPPVTFPPIARLSRVTISLERIGGGLYNTRGANHVIVLRLRRMTPYMDMASFVSMLPDIIPMPKVEDTNIAIPSEEESFFERYQM